MQQATAVANSSLLTISGCLERITFNNPENNFVVARLQERGKRDLTTIVGNLAGINTGESLKLAGSWVNDKKYGKQFKVEKFKTILPATAEGIKKYLGSGLIKGIGPVMAERIVATFGEQTFDILDEDSPRLHEVPGIGKKRIGMISRAWVEQKEIKNVMMFLQGYGVSSNYAAKIFKQYGKDAIQKVKENPYCLAADIQGIGFVTADHIARNMGIDPTSLLRVKEGVIYALNNLISEGNVYYPKDELLEAAAKMLAVDPGVVLPGLEAVLNDGRIVLDTVDVDVQAVYLSSMHTAEKNLAQVLNNLNNQPCGNVNADSLVSKAESSLGIRLAPAQKDAVYHALQNKVMVITGGPGTGKTTIIKAIAEIYTGMGLRVELAAPTGRAAKRIQESTGHPARTIHRLLEFSPQDGGFKRNQNNFLDVDAVIIDEVSMNDVLISYHLVKAIRPGASLILVGDVNQLPSVGPGNVLRDIIDSDIFTVITLSEIFRQAQGSLIVTNAHRINNGDFPILRPGKQSDFYFFEQDDPDKVLQEILRLYKIGIPKKFGLDPLKDIQVLSPMHRSVVGVGNLNIELQKLMNPTAKEVNRNGTVFKVGDKVLQKVNDYDKDVFNGDIGIISDIDDVDQAVRVNYDGREVAYDFGDMDELVLAYAISVHKSQGSEYPAVILPSDNAALYHAAPEPGIHGNNQGKKLTVVVGSKKALFFAIRNNKTGVRYTGLRERLHRLGS